MSEGKKHEEFFMRRSLFDWGTLPRRNVFSCQIDAIHGKNVLRFPTLLSVWATHKSPSDLSPMQ